MHKQLLIVFLFVLATCACTEKEKEGSGSRPDLKVDKEAINAPSMASQQSFTVTSNCYWNLSATDADGRAVTWVSLGFISGQGNMEVPVNIGMNTRTETRYAFIHISTPSSSDLDKKISIVQEPGGSVVVEGYEFPLCECLEIDSPQTRALTNAVIDRNLCMFTNGMILSRSNEEAGLSFVCPSHTQPSAGDDADKSIHRSIRMDGFAQGESVIISFPVKDALSGELRLMLGARAASFTKTGWSYYWGADGENWNKIGITCAETPGSDAVWNIIYFTIPESEAIPAGGTFYFKITADAQPSKEYIAISNTICVCPAKAPLSEVPAMDGDKLAFSTGFDDLVESLAPDVRYPLGLLRSASNSYASNATTFNDHYVVPAALAPFASAKGCYEKSGYLQVGYYDESLWTRICCGEYTIKIGERLKQMGVSSTDAKITLKACNMKDFRGYDNLAKATVSCGEESFVMEGLQDGVFAEYSFDFTNLTQESEIKITTPKLTDDELADLGRGANAKYLQDYRFFIDDIVVELTDVHERGSESQNDNENFSDGGIYNW
ncbi:MAG: BACON domain-containing protein [Bacteroidales bacterium]|nr:BACON domain-containing protein [Bacteroidales bacterium]